MKLKCSIDKTTITQNRTLLKYLLHEKFLVIGISNITCRLHSARDILTGIKAVIIVAAVETIR